MRQTVYIVCGLLAFIGVGASASFYFKDPYNPGFVEHPIITGIHVVLGGVYLAFAPFQFVQRIRNRAMGYHRWMGRLLAGSGLVVGAGGFFLGVFVPFSGWPERMVIGFFSVFFFVAIAKGVLYARAHEAGLHREWMIRAFAIGLGIATMRIIFVPILIAIGNPTQEQAEFFSILSFTVAFVVHALAAELWIRHTRSAVVRSEPRDAPAEVAG